MIYPEHVITMIKDGLPDAEVQALSPDGEHYEVTVVSSAFAGKGRVQQHQLVYEALQNAMATEAIHALALKTFTPEAWAATKT
jgi:acid stress-induced BolA-like protein IbaG/YrbA